MTRVPAHPGPKLGDPGPRRREPIVPVTTDPAWARVAARFTQHVYEDPQTGDTLPYNLFVPRGHDGTRSYPLVLFMHDAGSVSADVRATLEQGIGALCWATEESQAANPCLVLAPQYDTIIVNDDFEASSMRETTAHLVEAVVSEHNVDRDRIYATGQSAGAMMSLALGIQYPDLFAASLIVAGQWDPDLAAALVDHRMWIIVAEGDIKAFPGQNAITAALERRGARVARARWDGRSSVEALDRQAAALAARRAPINYVVLKGGTVVPETEDDNPFTNHRNTWRIAYTISAVRDWILAQTRTTAPARRDRFRHSIRSAPNEMTKTTHPASADGTRGSSELRSAEDSQRAQLEVLRQLSITGEMSVAEVASVIGMSLSSTNHIVEPLLAGGLVARTTTPDPERSAVIALTEDGREELARQRPFRSAAASALQAFGSPEVQELSHLLPALWRTLVRSTRASERMPALESHVSVLRKLAAYGDMPPARLADELHLARPTVSNLIKQLVADGLVQRRRSTTDGRGAIIALTPRGRQILEDFRRGRAEVLTDALSGIPEADRRMIVAALPSLEVLLKQLEDMSGGEPV